MRTVIAHASEPAHHHPSCGNQCDAAIANAISIPTVNVVSAAVLGGSDGLSLMPYLNTKRILITSVRQNTMIATMNAHIEGLAYSGRHILSAPERSAFARVAACLSGFGSGTYSAKLFAGTRQRFSGFNQPRQ